MDKREHGDKQGLKGLSKSNAEPKDLSKSDDITEEEETKLLADDEEDLDVIDCYTDDFDSDMEAEFCKREAKMSGTGHNLVPRAGTSSNMTSERKGNENSSRSEKNDTIEDKQKIAEQPVILGKDRSKATATAKNEVEHTIKNAEKASIANIDSAEIVEDDVIQIDDDNVELLLDETTNSMPKPAISLRIKDEIDTERILSGPLVKQMIIPEIAISDDDDEKDEVGSQESLSLQIDHLVDKASELTGGENIRSKKRNSASDGGPEFKIDYDIDSNGDVSGTYGCQLEDPDVLQLKLEFYQDMGEMDYEPDEEESRDISKGQKSEEEDKTLETHVRVRIKEEPITPVKERLKRIPLSTEEIPTIELSSSEDEDEVPLEQLRKTTKINEPRLTDKIGRKPGRKKNTATSEECQSLVLNSSEEALPTVDYTISDRSIGSRKRNDSDAGSMASLDDDLANYSDRVMALRKRRVTILPEAALVAGTKRTKTGKNSTDAKVVKEPIKKKKKIDPAMTGYKRRKFVSRSASKSSVISASTASSSVADEEVHTADSVDNSMTPVLVEKVHDSSGSKIDNTEKNVAQNEHVEQMAKTNEMLQQELMESAELENAIVKELEAQLLAPDTSSSKNAEHLSSTLIIPETTALEDMLEFYDKEEERQKQAGIAFHSISPEEKFLMDSLFADCDKSSPTIHDPLNTLGSILDDGKPLVERQDIVSKDDVFTLSYTICDVSTFLQGTPLTGQSAILEVDDSLKNKPKVNIIQGYQKYPFQPKVKKRPIKTIKITEPLPRTKQGRKRADSDEEYRPKGLSRPRRVTAPLRKRIMKPLQRNNFAPSGQYISPDSPLLHSLPTEGDEANIFKHMPSLEEDLALTSSDSSTATICAEKSVSSTSKDNYSSGIPSKSSLSEQSKLVSKKQVLEKAPSYDETERMEQAYEAAPAKPEKSARKPIPGRKRGRPARVVREPTIYDFFCPTHKKSTCSKANCQSEEPIVSASNEASQSGGTKGAKTAIKKIVKRKKKRTSSTSEEGTIVLNDGSSTSTITESSCETLIVATPVPSDNDPTQETNPESNTENEHEQTASASDIKMNNLQVVISPLTDDKIRQINTPKKRPKALTKASQTEICGLTWSIDLDQIDFHSEYFEKLRKLLIRGAARNISRKDVVEKSNRAAIHAAIRSPSYSPPPPQVRRIDPSSVGTCAERLLFQQAREEVEVSENNTDDRMARGTMGQGLKNVRSNFRIPKLAKQPSTSPQAVTSSTSNVIDPHDKDEQQAVAQRPAVSRCIDQRRSFERIDNNVPSCSSAVTRTTGGEYAGNDAVSYKSSNGDDQDELRRRIVIQEEFEMPPDRNTASGFPSLMKFSSALNSSYLSQARKEDEQRIGDSAAVNVQPTGPAALDRIVLPDRSEMVKVTRTIRNDMPQAQPILPQQQQQQQQPQLPLQTISQPFIHDDYKYNPQPLPGFHHTFGSLGTYGTGTGAYQRNFPQYSEMDVKPYIPTMYNAGMFGANGMSAAENPNAFNQFLMSSMTSLWEQFKQQQQPQQPPSTILQMSQPILQATSNTIQSGANHVSSSRPSSVSQLFPQLGLPATASQTDVRSSESMEVVSFLFGCYDFLTGKCIKVHCRYSHFLPREEDVYQKLMVQNRDFVMETYRFIAKRDDLFIKYFPVYAEVMGRNNMRHQLMSTIPDCEQSKHRYEYYRYVVDGLKVSGTSPIQAVQILLEKHTKIHFLQINIIVQLILDTGEGIPNFLRYLEDFYHVKDYMFEITSINRLLTICVVFNGPPKELVKFISKLVLNVAEGEEPRVNTKALLEFAKKIGQDPDMTLDVQEIVQKYATCNV